MAAPDYQLPARGRQAAALKKTYTDAERLAMLEGYIEVPRDLWAHIAYGVHLRYITTDGDFRTGGYVMKNFHDGSGGKTPRLKLQNHFGRTAKSYATWEAKYENLAYVYIRPGAAALVVRAEMVAAITQLNKNIRQLQTHIEAQGVRIAALEA